jgi:hypothetical protein
MGVRDTIAKALMGIKAYHSSPHDFDKFDLKKIGTGEGAQTYGHGLYFAENPKVSGQGGQYWEQFTNKFRDRPAEYEAAQMLKREDFNRESAIAKNLSDIQFYQKHPAQFQSQLDQALAQHEFLTSGKLFGPRTYEVNIKADPAQMLDWDKRIRPHQAEAINDTLELRMMQNHPDWRTYMQMQKDIPEASGKEAWQLLTSPEVARMKPPEASQFLQQHDIPGIKYLDEGSRGRQFSNKSALFQEPLTSNYVVFDPANVDILKKYGVAAAPTAALGATYDQGTYEEPDPMQGTFR